MSFTYSSSALDKSHLPDNAPDFAEIPAHSPKSVIPIKPHPDKLVVVTPVFNPYQYLKRYELYKTFKKMVQDSGALLMTVETVLGDRPYEITDIDDPWNIQTRSDQIIWIKEKAINLGVQKVLQIMPNCRYIGYLDADVSCSRSDWANAILQALQRHPVVQPFSHTMNMGPNHEILWKGNSLAKVFVDKIGLESLPTKKGYNRGHPGLGLFFTMEAFNLLGGLLDVMIGGSGDSFMMNCLTGNWFAGDFKHKSLKGFSQDFIDAVFQWYLRAKPLHNNIGYIDNTLLHMYHGKSSNRGYRTRWEILKKYQYSPYKDIKPTANGLYQFCGNKPGMVAELAATLQARNEDDISV